MKKSTLPSQQQIQQAALLAQIVNDLTPAACFALYQESIDKCPHAISAIILGTNGIDPHALHQNGDSFEALVVRHLEEGIRRYFKLYEAQASKRRGKAPKANSIVNR